MIRLGASSMFFHEYQPGEIFSALQTAGLDYVEFWMETPEFWMQGADPRNLLDLMQQFSSPKLLAMHAPIFDLNPCSFNPGVARLSIEYTCRCVEMMDSLGGGVVTIHPGKRTAKRPTGPLDRARLTAYLDAVGNAAFGTSVTVALENMPPAVNAQMVTPDAVRRILDEYSWLSFTWDYAHAVAAVPTDPFSFLSECGDRIVNIHASSGRAASMHTTLAGTEEGVSLLTELKRFGYSGLVTFELEDLNFGRRLGYEDKIGILAKETGWFSQLRSCGCIDEPAT
ncbi:hypothetical protein McpAg1_14330 [Methanocorpusculaceae archaeon Ag1]|uniref:Xylose isomerase-like TIM barrel domain-containing protein n=2 Tax=Methanorbis furvi TaxID=3028299 RepID=A0AAE4SAZ7_9EURY|nr:hypothetical protein [Methanocorpusculaceae archaeon Ag1]